MRLLHWSQCCFTDLRGFDPYVADDIRYADAVSVTKTFPSNDKCFDLIMMIHSFEHMPDPEAVLRQVRTVAADDHIAMIALPLSSSYAWEKYGINWVQLDAPRHFYLHTPKSMEIVADRCGYRVEKVVYNSTAFQFWGSELYLQDIPLEGPRSFGESAAKSKFSSDKIAAFEKQATDLNSSSRGDQASFYLRTKKH